MVGNTPSKQGGTMEAERLKFIEERDGVQAAIDFAKRGIEFYTIQAVEQSKYFASISAFAEYLEKHKKSE